ncbi:DUF6011 domain-containing protein [Streptomyces sp. ME19-01-6]|uniref:DUF6011 domain-containing protein n=1 Tax=Streptomyces sp. ME19-01-6 TaxID=3028686 RepID=UPI0029AA88DB|nr:DUF6011 domain-containing protein [Streptomyces sp. ME19-01-6]MDX3232913.1 DUF6011 domain-containing protein [Streptomyces sp. ME19-01-6]
MAGLPVRQRCPILRRPHHHRAGRSGASHLVTSRPARQAPLLGLPEQGRPPVYCRRCRRELVDAESRRRRYGAECDPDNRTPPAREHDVEQDPLPGT